MVKRIAASTAREIGGTLKSAHRCSGSQSTPSSDFDTETVDEMIERLIILRARMLPPLPNPAKLN